METESWNKNIKSIRSHLKLLTTIEALKKHPIQPNEKILEISLGDIDFSDALVKQFPDNHITHININAKNLTMSMHEVYQNENAEDDHPFHAKEFDHKNEFDIVFSFWLRQFFKVDIYHFFKYIYRSLKPCSCALILTPSIESSIIMTYQKVIASGKIPELTEASTDTYAQSIEKTKDCLSKLDFSKSEIIKMSHKVPLPNIELFRRFLHEIAFHYMPVMPTELSNEVIDMQVQFFDEHCQSHFDGQYYFEHTPYLIMAVK